LATAPAGWQTRVSAPGQEGLPGLRNLGLARATSQAQVSFLFMFATEAEWIMSATAPTHMTADEFIAWTMGQPEGRRYELVAGEVVAMAPERAAHGRMKGRIYESLVQAIRAAGLACEAFPDGMAVQVDADTIYEPDALVRCGVPLDDNAIKVLDPVIVVEVVSPSSRARDSGSKLEDYFRLLSVRHYLIVKTENHAVIHHERDATGAITTRILRDGPILLDPPGIELTGLF
jgi:Uma2 family endonuclease